MNYYRHLVHCNADLFSLILVFDILDRLNVCASFLPQEDIFLFSPLMLFLFTLCEMCHLQRIKCRLLGISITISSSSI